MSDMIGEDILRWGKKRGYGKKYAEYYATHLWCEAHQAYGLNIPAGPPHHINSRGAHGNIDENWNLISLCRDCHTLIHQVGDAAFCDHFPLMRYKIEAGREKIHRRDEHGKT